MHFHEACELVLYLNGRGTINAGDKPFPFKSGTVCYLPPGVLHNETSRTGYVSTWTQFSPARGMPRRVRVFQDGAHAPMRKIFEVLLHEYQKDPGAPNAAGEALVDALLALLAQRDSREPADTHVYHLRDRIVTHLADADFELEEAIQRLPCSRALAFRRFKDAFGLSPARFLVQRRLHQARQFLAIPDLTIRQVAQQVGYRDPYHFSKAFRKEFGSPPSAWREAILPKTKGMR
ncbi:MAG: helix-turn-helix domain-containing protein [Spirochaetes bacterium]|nr:helix-turn-helix domain-containing protein [Spirochaetota bacterium]